MTTKKENYTALQVQQMKDAYLAATNDAERKTAVETIAENMGRGVASIRAKLVNAKVYIKPEKTDKTGAPVMQKDAIVDEIATLCGVEDLETFDSLAKANKSVLNVLKLSLTPPVVETETETS
jgi:hypothetical protein